MIYLKSWKGIGNKGVCAKSADAAGVLPQSGLQDTKVFVIENNLCCTQPEHSSGRRL